MLSGEIIAFLEIIAFRSKAELLNKLNTMNKNVKCLSDKDRHIITQILTVAIEQVTLTTEDTLLKYAKHKEANEAT